MSAALGLSAAAARGSHELGRTATVVVVVFFVVVVVVVVVSAAGCGIAPIQREGSNGVAASTPGPPRTHRYVGAHGRPRAWGGGVCPVLAPHDHLYPPVPPLAFALDDGAWRDRRGLQAYAGPNPWGQRRCTQSVWHQHAIDDGAPSMSDQQSEAHKIEGSPPNAPVGNGP